MERYSEARIKLPNFSRPKTLSGPSATSGNRRPPLRLLDTKTLTLRNSTEISWNSRSTYAILSHTWENQELTLEELRRNPSKIKTSKKVRGACEQARRDGKDYIWIDSCCIDRSSSAELSEAINSMFAWYSNSTRCYIYLSDVGANAGGFSHSRWYRRAWTLQELLAPRQFEVFDCNWNSLGTNKTLLMEISEITGIDKSAFGGNLGEFSIATRMSWAANRKATRPEDVAYSLLGLFHVNMPLIYGEGKVNAFRRLQNEILNNSSDQSIFAWNFSAKADAERWAERPSQSPLLATSPDQFEGSRNIFAVQKYESAGNNGNLELQMPVYSIRRYSSVQLCIVLLACLFRDGDETFCIGMLVECPLKEGKYDTRCFVDLDRATMIIPASRWFWSEIKTVRLQPPKPSNNRAEPLERYRPRSYLNVGFHEHEYKLLYALPKNSFIFDDKKEGLGWTSRVFHVHTVPELSELVFVSVRDNITLTVSITSIGIQPTHWTMAIREGDPETNPAQKNTYGPWGVVLEGNMFYTDLVGMPERQAVYRLETGNGLATVATFSASEFLDKKYYTLKIGEFRKGPDGWANSNNVFPYPSQLKDSFATRNSPTFELPVLVSDSEGF